MRVYVLYFENLGRLTRAFDRVLEHSDVESSMIEPDGMRLRFLGPRARRAPRRRDLRGRRPVHAAADVIDGAEA